MSYDPPGPAILLSTNTEVTIAPKLRAKPSSSLSGPNAPSLHQPDAATSIPKSFPHNKVILRAFPYDLLPQGSSIVSDESSQGCVWVSPRVFFQFTGEKFLPETSLLASQQRYVSIRRLRPPVSPQSGTQKSGSLDGPPPISPNQARIIHKVVPTVVGERTPSEFEEAVLLRSSKHIPDHHFIYLEMDGIEEWDLAWFAAMIFNSLFVCILKICTSLQLLTYAEQQKLPKAVRNISSTDRLVPFSP